MLSRLPRQVSEKILVGLDTSDDAGVYLLDSGEALIQTVDFFTPVVDDPFDYGQIAAANSLSDVYAMGGRPVTALNIVCFPTRDGDEATLCEILLGGAEKIAESGALLLGGHTVTDDEIKYGLSVSGLAPRDRLTPNSGGAEGDLLILTKPLGAGIITTALKAGAAAGEHVAEAVRWMKQLNAGAAAAAAKFQVRGATDITGFGLLGHLHEVAAGSLLSAEIWLDQLPALPGALQYAASGTGTAGAEANRRFLESHVRIQGDAGLEEALLYDPQTSGGLLLCIREPEAENLLEELKATGHEQSSIIGCLRAGPAGSICVTARP